MEEEDNVFSQYNGLTRLFSEEVDEEELDRLTKISQLEQLEQQVQLERQRKARTQRPQQVQQEQLQERQSQYKLEQEPPNRPYDFQEVTNSPIFNFLMDQPNKQKHRDVMKKLVNNHKSLAGLDHIFTLEQEGQSPLLQQEKIPFHKKSMDFGLQYMFQEEEKEKEPEEKKREVLDVNNYFKQKLKPQIYKNIEKSIKTGTTKETQKQFIKKFDNFIELEKMTQENLFEDQMKKCYAEFLMNFQNEQNKKQSMENILKQVSAFTMNIAQKLTQKISKCDHEFCFEEMKKINSQKQLDQMKKTNISNQSQSISNNSNQSVQNQPQFKPSSFFNNSFQSSQNNSNNSTNSNNNKSYRKQRWSDQELNIVQNAVQQCYPEFISKDTMIQLQKQIRRSKKAIQNKIHQLRKQRQLKELYEGN